MNIGILGCGNMGTALARAVQTSGHALILFDTVSRKAKESADEYGATLAAGAGELVQKSDCCIVAVKPSQIAQALAGDFAANAAGKLVISVAAGIPLTRLETLLPESRLVRVMPNTPALIGKGVLAFSTAPGVSDDDRELVNSLLEPAGLVVPVEEKYMDTVTGLSGSGPAYAFVIINALAEGAVRLGLGKEQALKMAAQTMAGAAELVLESGKHPELLKDRVTSPGGTTAAALARLEAAGIRSALIEAVGAAEERARELGKE